MFSFFNFGANNCNGDPAVFPEPMDAATFQAGLLDFRMQIATVVQDGGTPNFGTFYLPGTQHTWLTFGDGDTLFTASAGGVRLLDWFTGIIDGDAPTHVGP